MSESVQKWEIVEGVHGEAGKPHNAPGISGSVQTGTYTILGTKVYVGSATIGDHSVTIKVAWGGTISIASIESLSGGGGKVVGASWQNAGRDILHGAATSVVLNPSEQIMNSDAAIARAWSRDMVAVGGDFNRAIAGALNARQGSAGRR